MRDPAQRVFSISYRSVKRKSVCTLNAIDAILVDDFAPANKAEVGTALAIQVIAILGRAKKNEKKIW